MTTRAKLVAYIFLTTLICTLSVYLAHPTIVRAQANGTTLIDASKTAVGHWTRTYHWTIDKWVAPDILNLFQGDTGNANYTITVTKDAGTDNIFVDGEICFKNDGAVATQDLAISDEVLYKSGGGPFQSLTTASVDTSSNPVLDPGETGCYPYNVPFAPPVGATEYKNTAHITITNHSGHLGTPFGPNPSAAFSLPATPTPINGTINVDDTNGTSFSFPSSGSQSYDKPFTCGTSGSYDNKATIRETGDYDIANVKVNCYSLEVTKDAATDFTRTYDWTIDKSADQSSLVLALNQSFTVNYSVILTASYTDSAFEVNGTISVYNPAPMGAPLNGVSDLVSGGISATVDCGVDFPYILAAGGTLTCSYHADLPDASARTNTATATLQNTPSGTTDFSGTANVTFGAPSEVDECINVYDTLQGTLGTVCANELPKTFSYSRTVGPYTTCGDSNVTNTASFVTNDTGTTDSASTTVNVHVPCATGCTLTIGYWKTHAGFTGKNADMVTPLLPIWLGTSGGTKSVQVTSASQAVTLLSMNGDASNGINKLYAQLLGAKLNIASGASSSAVNSTITAADAFLATKNAADWSGLTKAQKNQVIAWAATLDGYNNGLTGPGHCSQ